MISLYHILIEQGHNDDPRMREIKKSIYNLFYMDNGAYSPNDIDDLFFVYSKLEEIFSPFKFEIQQCFTNNQDLQAKIDDEFSCSTEHDAKLLGLKWNRVTDELFVSTFTLDPKANTKRSILSSIAKNFDIFNMIGPLLNRARLFLHGLQGDPSLGWDEKLTKRQVREWKNICKQVTNGQRVKIDRCLGSHSETYDVVSFSDASHSIYGTVIYLISIKDNELKFLLGKNKIVGTKLKGKSTPSLEFNAIVLGVETLLEVKEMLSGPDIVKPVKFRNFYLFTDSMISLNWLMKHVNKIDKNQNLSVFIKNRLNHISELCDRQSIWFGYCAGVENPADIITRPISANLLLKSNYFTGPKMSNLLESLKSMGVLVPNPKIVQTITIQHSERPQVEHLYNIERTMSLRKMVRIYSKVLKFIDITRSRDSQKLQSDKESLRLLILRDQEIHFPEIFHYFSQENACKANIPPLVARLNLSISNDGLVRVKSKFARFKDSLCYFPTLLAKNSHLTKAVILFYHEQFKHCGIYFLLSELRKHYYIEHVFSQIKRVLKDCVICKRLNSRTIKINQNSYPDFRVHPPSIPYKYIFIDYFGPYSVMQNNERRKVYALCITCLWSRAINIKVCVDMTTESFLRALSLHVLEYGIPEQCLSDLGSNLTSGSKIISTFLSDITTRQYLSDNKIQPIKFQHYDKGRNELGSLIETCVSMVKRLIFKSIGNLILEFLDFEYLICNVIHLVNKRPIAFKDSLRDCISDGVPSPITPELLLKGYHSVSLNLIPGLHPSPHTDDPDWEPSVSKPSSIISIYKKLKNAREKLVKIYHEEFIAKLIYQAVNERDRYKPKNHNRISKGDIVLIKDPYMKSTMYPMAIVRDLTVNSFGEITSVKLLKGATGELVQRHSTSLVPLLSPKSEIGSSKDEVQINARPRNVRPKRQAAMMASSKTKLLFK